MDKIITRIPLKILLPLFLVLASIWPIIQAYDYFFNDYKLRASGEYYPITLPDQIYERMYIFEYCPRNFKEFMEPSNLKTLIETTIETKTINTNKQELILNEKQLDSLYDKLTTEICNSIEKNFPRRELQYLYKIKTIYIVDVQNYGSKEIQNTKIILPFDGLYRIIDFNTDGHYLKFSNDILSAAIDKEYWKESLPFIDNGPYIPNVKMFSKEIDLGTSTPTERFVVVIWTSDLPNIAIYRQEEIRITSSAGVTRIEFPRKVRGILSWLDENRNGLSGAFLGLIIGLILLYLISKSKSQIPRTPDSDNDKST